MFEIGEMLRRSTKFEFKEKYDAQMVCWIEVAKGKKIEVAKGKKFVSSYQTELYLFFNSDVDIHYGKLHARIAGVRKW